MCDWHLLFCVECFEYQDNKWNCLETLRARGTLILRRHYTTRSTVVTKGSTRVFQLNCCCASIITVQRWICATLQLSLCLLGRFNGHRRQEAPHHHEALQQPARGFRAFNSPSRSWVIAANARPRARNQSSPPQFRQPASLIRFSYLSQYGSEWFCSYLSSSSRSTIAKRIITHQPPICAQDWSGIVASLPRPLYITSL